MNVLIIFCLYRKGLISNTIFFMSSEKVALF